MSGISASTEAKAAAFDEILAYYLGQGVDDTESDWQQGSAYDDAVRRYLGVPTMEEVIAMDLENGF